MGIVEEAGSSGRHLFGILGRVPVLLTLLLLNTGTFVMISYLLVKASDARLTEGSQFREALERCYVRNREDK